MTGFAGRVLTAIVGLPAVVLLVYFGGLPMLVAIAVAAIVGLREFYVAFDKADKPLHWVGYAATLGYFTAIHFFGAGYWLLIAITVFIIVVQACLVIFYKHLPIRECVIAVYGFLYVTFLLSFIVLIRQHDLGQYFVWLVFTTAFGCDTFAYTTGVTLGKHRLANSPSPKKSIEGVVGGIIGAGLVGLVYGLLMNHFGNPPSNFVIIAIVVSLVGAVFSVIGDMAASAVKRHTEIKDFGKLFPGHGGVMDRIDSIIMVAPIVYLALMWWVA